MARHVHLCREACNTVWSHMAGDTPQLWDEFPKECYTPPLTIKSATHIRNNKTTCQCLMIMTGALQIVTYLLTYLPNKKLIKNGKIEAVYYTTSMKMIKLTGCPTGSPWDSALSTVRPHRPCSQPVQSAGQSDAARLDPRPSTLWCCGPGEVPEKPRRHLVKSRAPRISTAQNPRQQLYRGRILRKDCNSSWGTLYSPLVMIRYQDFNFDIILIQ